MRLETISFYKMFLALMGLMAKIIKQEYHEQYTGYVHDNV
jgi:beta-lactamase class D